MYENEEEIKKKRRNLLIIIIIIIILILLLLLFLFTRGKGKTTVAKGTLKCELEVKSGYLGENGIYTGDVEVGFKSITGISKDLEITKNTVGITDNSRNTETYTVTKKGKTVINGYVQDEAGNKGTCSLVVEIDASVPSCELEIKSGTAGDNGWYKSDVVIGFKTKETTSTSTKIEKFYLEEVKTELDSNRVIRSDPPAENMDSYTLKDNKSTRITGYVIDSNGNEGTCSITVKKDSEPPKCSLKVISGTKNAAGQYTTAAVVGFDSTTDNASDIAAKGVGTSINYKDETFAVSNNGTTVVNGYVKDKAGNEGTCSISITKTSGSGGGSGTVQPPQPTSYPSCTLTVTGTLLSEGVYIPTATVKFSTKSSTNGATITEFGLGTTAELNGKESLDLTTIGTHNILGMVKDSNGKTATCSISVNIQEDNRIAKKVAVGDYIAYDAGTWTETVGVPSTNGKFGGYKAGASKNSSVKCESSDTSSAVGWRVLSINGDSVTIAHTGISECYFHGQKASADTAIATLNERAKIYMNDYAESARMLTLDDVNANTTFKNISSNYYMAQKKDSTTLYVITASGRETGGSEKVHGIRPVITLKSSVRTTGKDQSGAWILTQ